tara:strand:+ start:150 stop:512 length:363 start_codon:yes stop_codon:yes gene_type:complete
MNSKFITNVETKVNGETIEVTVSVMPFNDYRCREKVSLGLREINILIKEKDIKVGKCIQNPYIQNKVRSTATWVFENPSYRKPTPRTTQKEKTTTTKRRAARSNKKRKNSTKLQKNLDNS